MSSSVASSPVLFNSPPPGLKPAPLRIPDRKSKGSDDANEREFWGAYADHHTPPSPTSKEPCMTPPPSSHGHSGSLNYRRVTSTKLDSLVSKFEILDAVNNADEEVPWLPQHPTSNNPDVNPDSQHLSPPQASSLARRVLGHSTSSHEKASTTEDSSDLSPLSTRPIIPARRSNLPPSSQSKVITTDDALPPATPSRKSHGLPKVEKDSVDRATRTVRARTEQGRYKTPEKSAISPGSKHSG